MVIDVPGMPGVPGAKVPPELIVTVKGSIVPPPPVSVPPEFTTTPEVPPSVPSTSRMPAFTAVVPV